MSDGPPRQSTPSASVNHCAAAIEVACNRCEPRSAVSVGRSSRAHVPASRTPSWRARQAGCAGTSRGETPRFQVPPEAVRASDGLTNRRGKLGSATSARDRRCDACAGFLVSLIIRSVSCRSYRRGTWRARSMRSWLIRGRGAANSDWNCEVTSRRLHRFLRRPDGRPRSE